MASVSSLLSGPESRDVPAAKPATNNALLVMLFDPGGRTVTSRATWSGSISSCAGNEMVTVPVGVADLVDGQLRRGDGPHPG